MNFGAFASIRSIVLLALLSVPAFAAPPATQPGKLPFIDVDVAKKVVRVQCEAIRIDAPLEFFAVRVGGPEHEAVLRTPAKPSDIHIALLMLGLEPGEPVRFSEATGKWIAPTGPPLRVSVEFSRVGETVHLPAAKLVRSIVKKEPMPDRPFVFTGSRILDNNRYAADETGYIVSIVNFDLAPIDVSQVASNANETLEWEINPDVAPEQGTKVTMLIEPVKELPIDPESGRTHSASSGQAATGVRSESETSSAVQIDQQKVDALAQLWKDKVTPHDQALREAAQAQYDVIRQLRREQQRLIDEADRIQRLIDDLERKYQDMTTPRPTEPTPPKN